MATAFQIEAFQFDAFQIDAGGGSVGPVGETNWALDVNGGVATASSYLSPYTPARANNGLRTGKQWGQDVPDSGWNDNTPSVYPDWLQITFAKANSIDTINVITLQDPVGGVWTGVQEPTLTTTFTMYGITAFDVQYWDGTIWVTFPGGSVTGNNKVWRQFTFAPVVTTAIRVKVNAGLFNSSRIVELEAWGGSGSWSGVSRGRNLFGTSRGRI